MIELITGADFEQRTNALILTTTGEISIAVYLANPTWTLGGVPRSAIWTNLLAAPATGRTCRITMATPAPASPALVNNQAARDALTAAGWLVRFAPAVPALHAKVYTVAPYWSLIGSYNLSNRAATGNIECATLTNDRAVYALARQLTLDAYNAGS